MKIFKGVSSLGVSGITNECRYPPKESVGDPSHPRFPISARVIRVAPLTRILCRFDLLLHVVYHGQGSLSRRAEPSRRLRLLITRF